MITGKKEELEQITQTHKCPEHDARLVVAWHAGENAFVIRCGAGHFPEEVVSIPTAVQEFKQGTRAPVGQGLNLLPMRDSATGEELAPDLIVGLIDYAKKYGLDAFRGHVVIMYGKPYIGLDGYLYYANKTRIPYSLTSKPMNPIDRLAYQVDEDDHAWLAEVHLITTDQVFNGTGIVPAKEMTETSGRDKSKLKSPVVAAHPWQLAQKRAEWQAMRRAFPIGEKEENNGG